MRIWTTSRIYKNYLIKRGAIPVFIYKELSGLLADQLFIGKKPNPNLFEEVSNGFLLNKPVGGLWTSPFIDLDHGSDWVQWSLENKFSYGSSGVFPAHLLHIERGTKYYKISSYDDLERLFNNYGYEPLKELKNVKALNFERIRKHYDAIYLTGSGQEQTRLSFPYNLYGWDCESVLFLNWKVKRIDTLGEIRFNLFMDE
jgi:hypothetical protein